MRFLKMLLPAVVLIAACAHQGQETKAVVKDHVKIYLDVDGGVTLDTPDADGEVAAASNDETPIAAGGVFHVWCTDKNGNVEWDVYTHNTLANDGANYLRDMFYKANATTLIANAPVIGLLTATPTITTTLSTMTEATGGAYARKTVTWTTTNPGSANNTASAASWTASGTAITAVTHLFISDATSGTSGKFMAFASLTGGPYTVNVGSTLNVTYTWTVALNDAPANGFQFLRSMPAANDDIIESKRQAA